MLEGKACHVTRCGIIRHAGCETGELLLGEPLSMSFRDFKIHLDSLYLLYCLIFYEF